MTRTNEQEPQTNNDEWKLEILSKGRNLRHNLPEFIEEALKKAVSNGVEAGPDDGDTLGNNDLNNLIPPDSV